MAIARTLESAEAICRVGPSGLDAIVRQAQIRPDSRLITRVLTWGATAPAPEAAEAARRRIRATLWSDLDTKRVEIGRLGRDLANELCQTPYVTLLSIPGVGVIGAAEYAAEAGPIECYATPKAISGRAGLFPARYQSDETDKAGGLLRSANRRLRGAIMTIAFCLSRSNSYFRQRAQQWKSLGVPPLAVIVRIANRFCRISFHMVARRTRFRHPCSQTRDYVMAKLLRFTQEQGLSVEQTQRMLLEAARQMTAPDLQDEKQEWPDNCTRLRNVGVAHNGSAKCCRQYLRASRLASFN